MTDFTSEQLDVKATMESLVNAFSEKDLDKVMSFYQEGAKIVFEPNKEIDHRGQMRAWFEGVLLVNPQYQFSDPIIVVNGNIASYQAHWSMEGKGRNEQPIKLDGMLVNILTKNSDGLWQILIDNPHGHAVLHS